MWSIYRYFLLSARGRQFRSTHSIQIQGRTQARLGTPSARSPDSGQDPETLRSLLYGRLNTTVRTAIHPQRIEQRHDRHIVNRQQETWRADNRSDSALDWPNCFFSSAFVVNSNSTPHSSNHDSLLVVVSLEPILLAKSFRDFLGLDGSKRMAF